MALSLKNKQLEGRPLKLGGGARSGTGASYREAERAEESAFEAGDYHNFDTHLGEETRMAMAWAGEGNFRSFSPPTVGCEVESCLMDGDGAPLPESAQFLQYFSNDNGYYEMSKYNVEFEIDPVRLDGTPFSALCDSLENNRLHASRCADLIEARVASFRHFAVADAGAFHAGDAGRPPPFSRFGESVAKTRRQPPVQGKHRPRRRGVF